MTLTIVRMCAECKSITLCCQDWDVESGSLGHRSCCRSCVGAAVPLSFCAAKEPMHWKLTEGLSAADIAATETVTSFTMYIPHRLSLVLLTFACFGAAVSSPGSYDVAIACASRQHGLSSHHSILIIPYVICTSCFET